MLPLAIYMLKVVLISGILFGYYALALKNERFHSWNRYYLVLSAVLSLLLPFARWSALFPGSPPAPIAEYRLHVFTLQAHSAQQAVLVAGTHRAGWPLILYALVCISLLAGIAHGLLAIARRIREGEKQRFPLFTLVNNRRPESPFSFFRYIFWNDAIPLQSKDGRHILRHELVHVQQKHSIDKLLMETLLALCWINPFFYLIRRELHTIHEFIADRKSCYPQGPRQNAPENMNPREYAALLLNQALGSNRIGLANHFFQKELTRRVRMLIRENRTRCSWLKRVMAIPLALGLMSFFMILQSQAREKGVPLLNQMTGNKTFTKAAEPAKTTAADPVNSPANKDEDSRVRKIRLPKKPSLAAVIFNKMLPDRNAEEDLKADVGLRPSTVFTFVKQMPQFPGGEEALLHYLHENIHYPAEAVSNGVEGTVVVQFIIHPDGRLTDITTVGPVKGAGLEQEAIRVVKSMPEWIPGKQNGKPVAVRYALPVRFLLNAKTETEPASHPLPPPTPPSTHPQFVEQMPHFPGGEAALMRYLHDHIRYPSVARENGIQGTVFTQFTVNADGSLSNIRTTGPKIGGGLEDEAMRVIRQMPSWQPGIQNGRKAAAEYALPIRFVLQ